MNELALGSLLSQNWLGLYFVSAIVLLKPEFLLSDVFDVLSPALQDPGGITSMSLTMSHNKYDQSTNLITVDNSR